MLSLLLVVGLCSDNICSYMDVTQRMQVASDAHCYELATLANQQNLGTDQEPRYNCVTPERFQVLMGEPPAAPVEPAAPRKVL